MKIDPKTIFILSIVATILQGLASGSVHLTDIVPTGYMGVVTGWIGLLNFVVLVVLSALVGYSSAKPGPLAPPPTVPEAREVMKQAVDAVVKKEN